MHHINRPFSILPGLRPTLAYSLCYLTLIVVIPLSCLIASAFMIPWSQAIDIVLNPRTLHAFYITLSTSFIAAFVNLLLGLLIAWVIERHHFPGKSFLDAAIDLPFALPTAVAGIALTTLYAPTGWIGSLLQYLHIDAVFTPLGIVIALIFVGFPFVVRTVQPVIADLPTDVEEAATLLGANSWQSFYRVILPELWPSLLTGFTLAFARALGEYGSVIFIAGNIPYFSEIIPLLIVIKLEAFDYNGATIIATSMLFLSFIALLIINLIQKYGRTA
jgi:sulfate transport system permease protein